MTKICSKCKKEKPISGFYKQRTAKNGYKNQCKKCYNNLRNTEGYKPVSYTHLTLPTILLV